MVIAGLPQPPPTSASMLHDGGVSRQRAGFRREPYSLVTGSGPACTASDTGDMLTECATDVFTDRVIHDLPLEDD